MKIKMSKEQWEKIGNETGWTKTSGVIFPIAPKVPIVDDAKNIYEIMNNFYPEYANKGFDAVRADANTVIDACDRIKRELNRLFELNNPDRLRK